MGDSKSKTTRTATNIHSLFRGGTGRQTTTSAHLIEENIESQLRPQEQNVQRISLDLLLDNPYQPRETIEIDDALRELAGSIAEHGFQGVIPARKHPERIGYFQLAYGHRRREASRLAGEMDMPILLQELSNRAMAGIAAAENVHRKDLTVLQLGKLFLTMQGEGYTQDEIAKTVGKDRGYIVNRLRVATAAPDIQQFIQEKPDSLRAVSYLIKVPDHADRTLLIELLTKGTLKTDDLGGDVSELVQSLKTSQPPQSTYPSLTPSDEEGTSTGKEQLSTTAPKRPSLQEDYVLLESEVKEHNVSLGESPSLQSIDELTLARLGSRKLATIVRALKSFQQEAQDRQQFSGREHNLVNEIANVVRELEETLQASSSVFSSNGE